MYLLECVLMLRDMLKISLWIKMYDQKSLVTTIQEGTLTERIKRLQRDRFTMAQAENSMFLHWRICSVVLLLAVYQNLLEESVRSPDGGVPSHTS
jgi:hypothetical protein